MKPSRYTFLIVPDHDGKNRQFSISRNGTLVLIFTIVGIITSMVIGLLIFGPKAFDHDRMKNRYSEVIEERTEVLELYRDLERMKQMELVVQKALGSNLAESEIEDGKLVETINDQKIRAGYLNNVPSLLPVSGVVTQNMIIDNKDDIRKHLGVDIAVPIGEPILASASGQVVFSGWTPDLGNLVVIYHNNEYFTYYGHNELILVNSYEKVDRGDAIATSGNSGISSGPHLHFEIWKDGEPVDPLLYFPELNQSNISVE